MRFSESELLRRLASLVEHLAWPSRPAAWLGRIVMEAKAFPEHTRGTFMLTLQDASGGPALILGDITFP